MFFPSTWNETDKSLFRSDEILPTAAENGIQDNAFTSPFSPPSAPEMPMEPVFNAG